MSSTDDRRFEVLRAIVADYVSTQDPVGSKALVERHNLGVSSATVRNDMAFLEAEGYIAQPHTSSGRVPTDKGYREFVDRIADVKPLSGPERRAILEFLESGVDLDDVLRRGVRLLAQLTRQVAVVQYPTLSASSVRHLEVVALTPARLLLVLITDSGRVDQRIVELGDVLVDEDLSRLRALLGGALEGKRLAAASIAVSNWPTRLPTICATPLSGPRRSWSRHWSSIPRSVWCSADGQPDAQCLRLLRAGRIPGLVAGGARSARRAGCGAETAGLDPERRDGYRPDR